jgi:hypothetical protein
MSDETRRVMRDLPVYRSILAIDVEGFGRQERTDILRARLRRELHELITDGLRSVGAETLYELSDTGDGVLVFVDPRVSKVRLVDTLVSWLGASLRGYNRRAGAAAELRLRVVMHAGDMISAQQGAIGDAVVLAARLLDAPVLRACLGATDTPLVVGVSRTIYEEVIRHAYANIDPASFAPVSVDVKETRTTMWVHVPGDPDALARVGLATAMVRSPVGWEDSAFLRHWDPRARGVPESVSRGWHFTGRTRVLRELVDWISSPQSNERAACVVTGSPGSGKSAVLGRLVTLADPEVRSTVPGGLLRQVAAGAIPPTGSIQAALHLAGKTPEQVASTLAAAMGRMAASCRDLTDQLLEHGDPMVIVFDALDEMSEPERLARELLEPLAAQGGGVGIRLLIGTRRHLVTLLPSAKVIDLDEAIYFEHADLAAYAHRLLTADDESVGSNPPRDNLKMADEVAEAIAARAAPSFLIAQLVARSLREMQRPPDLADAAWREWVPTTLAAALDETLDRYVAESPRARDLLLALAWVDRAGPLPDAAHWAALASELSGFAYREADVSWLLGTPARNLLAISEEEGRDTYRLFHPALADHLRTIHGSIQPAPGRDTPEPPGPPDRSGMPPGGGGEEPGSLSGSAPRRHYRLVEVFKSSGVPSVTFVEPADFYRLKLALEQSGRGVLIEGPSGGGKTTALRQAVEQLQLSDQLGEVEVLSARISSHLDRIEVLEAQHAGIVAIDDFHRLNATLQAKLTDYLKYLADNEPPDKKLVIVGIPGVGKKLVDMAFDIATRVELLRFGRVADELVENMIDKGEDALNITIDCREDIVEAAAGSLQVAQIICCYLAAIEGIVETQHRHVHIGSPGDALMKATAAAVEQLARKFDDAIRSFAELGGPTDLTGIELLQELARSGDGVLSLRRLRDGRPELAGAIEMLMAHGLPPSITPQQPASTQHLLYDDATGLLIADDPQLTFYLRRVPPERLAMTVGKLYPTDRRRVFISYSHADARWLERLLVHLKPLHRDGLVDIWSDQRIRPGEVWRAEIVRSLNVAKVAVLLVSANFLASDFVMEVELPHLLSAAEQQGCRVLPLIVSPCRFEDTVVLGQYQAVNAPSRPLTGLGKNDQEKLLVQLSREIEAALPHHPDGTLRWP